MALLHALQRVKLPEFPDDKTLMPVVHIDATQLADMVKALHTSLAQQMCVMEAMEREQSKRKMEVDIHLRNVKGEFEERLRQEGKMRDLAVQKLRNELTKESQERQESEKKAETARKETLEHTAIAMEKHTAPLKMMVKEANVKLFTLGDDVKGVSAKVKEVSFQMDQMNDATLRRQESIEKETAQLRALLSLTKSDVATAVESGQQVETLSSTPAFRDIHAKLATLTDTGRQLDGKVGKLGDSLQLVEDTFRSLQDKAEKEIEQLFVKSADGSSKFDAYTEAAASRMERFAGSVAYKADLGCLARHADLVSSAKSVNRALEDLHGLIDRSSTEREALARELQQKADWSSVLEKAEKHDVEERLLQMDRWVQDVTAMLEEVQAQVAVEHDRAGRYSSDLREAPRAERHTSLDIPKRSSPDSQQQHTDSDTSTRTPVEPEQRRDAESEDVTVATVPIPPVKLAFEVPQGPATPQAVAGGAAASQPSPGGRQHSVRRTSAETTRLLESVKALTGDLHLLDQEKVGRKELHSVLQELLAKGALAAAPAPANPAQGVGGDLGSDPSTALRFRCLSCNRTAGNLASDHSSATGAQTFPPSSVFIKGTGGGGGSGEKDGRRTPEKLQATAAMSPKSATRKKLSNYYDWLRSKGLHHEKAGGGKTPEEFDNIGDTPSPRRPASPAWDGAQPGGGEPKTRQCGNHGSSAPFSIGSDGKFYPGVRGRVPAHEPPSSTVAAHAAPADQLPA